MPKFKVYCQYVVHGEAVVEAEDSEKAVAMVECGQVDIENVGEDWVEATCVEKIGK